MTYIVGPMNHFAALQRLAGRTGAQISLDVSTFVVEVKLRNRYYRFQPQFLIKRDGRFAQTPTLTDDAVGFSGWRPYAPFAFPLATDKLAFKRHFEAREQQVPATWLHPRDADRDFVVKRSIGSYGMAMSGPFRVEERSAFDIGAAAIGGGEVFAEAFVEGTIVKVWYWGQRAFFAHRQVYPTIEGDGTSRVSELARARMQIADADWIDSAAAKVAHACLRYQGLAPDDVLRWGRTAWIDYRYGRSYAQAGPTRSSDNELASFGEDARAQIDSAGVVAAQALMQTVPVPVAYALDAMLDAEGKLWWLEMNSNPTVPPEGYAEMFADLFG
jgi:hypothetical protein